MAGLWNNDSSSKTRPGLYLRFVEGGVAAVQQQVGGTIAIPLVNYGTGATAKSITIVSDVAEAETKFGAGNVQSIKLAFEAGVEKVVVYALEAVDGVTITEKIAYDNARYELDKYPFDAFVYDGVVSPTEQDACLKWVQKSRTEGKPFMVVFGKPSGTTDEDKDIVAGNNRSVRLADEYAVNLVIPVVKNGVALSSAAFAPYIAGEIVKTPLNQSITFNEVAAEDVGLRLTVQQVKDSLAAGSLVLTHNGEYVRVEQGLVTKSKDADGLPKVHKIRKTRVRQVISVDLTKLIEGQIIGKINNDDDGYAFAITMCKVFLEQLEQNGVITDIGVRLDPENESTGDQLFIAIDFVELDSVERVFLTVSNLA